MPIATSLMFSLHFIWIILSLSVLVSFSFLFSSGLGFGEKGESDEEGGCEQCDQGWVGGICLHG